MAEFFQFLRTDPQFYAKTPRELLSYSAYISKKADWKLGETIGFLPRRRHGIRPVPDALAPIYTGGRGGLDACLMNTYNLPARPLYTLAALTLHECTPGHSFQAALALEGPDRPPFRRGTSFSAYGEGWGLYTEWLGTVMGIYETPYEDFGRLTYEMWRACRLVIDTGIHAFGWSREEAMDYLRTRAALSDHEITTEIERYIAWPGQALAYKLGELQIRRHRREAEEKLGSKFDQRHFHDAILALGSVPLPVLEQRMTQFIADGGVSAPPPGECAVVTAPKFSYRLRMATGTTTFSTVVIAAVASAVLSAQNPADIEQTYSTRCGGCHGDDGRGTAQGPALAGSLSVRARSAQSLRTVIRNGIPAAGMPAFDLPADTIDALATMITSWNAVAAKASVPGDAAAGRQFFVGKGQCVSCHLAQGEGSAIGPDLSDIALTLTVDEIRDALRESRRADRARLWRGFCSPARWSNAARLRAKPQQFRPGYPGSDRRVSHIVAR